MTLYYVINDVSSVDHTSLYTNAFSGVWHLDQSDYSIASGVNSYVLENANAGYWIWNVWVDDTGSGDYYIFTENQSFEVIP